MFERILVCVDGTAAGYRATRVAVEVAARFHAVLTLLTVQPPRREPRDFDLERLVPVGDGRESLQHHLEKTEEEAKTRGAPRVDVVFLSGEVVPTILSYLQSHPHDLIVVGSRGLSRGNRFLRGSVSTELVSQAPCPVLVVRAGDRKTAEPHRSRKETNESVKSTSETAKS